MDKIKSWLRSMPLRSAFISLVLVMAVLVAGISVVTIYTCVKVQDQILESVTEYQTLPPQKTEGEYNIVIADDNQIVPGENGQLVILSTEYQIANLSESQRVAYYAAKAAVVLVPTLLFVVGTVLCAWIFYTIKLKQPLSLLLQSANRISQSDLDFHLDYSAADEMGDLCRAMDTMRTALLKSNQETWTMIEERRRLNASIAHDLRTPITVMKGYTEYLSHNVPLGRISEDKLLNTIHNLSLATERLEQYANQVREIQAMDAMPIKPVICSLREFFEELEDAYTILTEQHQLHFVMDISGVPNIRVMLDEPLVHRMIDNVISNALRFANNEISLKVGWIDSVLTIEVVDDGVGFSEESLQSAVKPFYKENTENAHYGLGLSICNTLCQKQGGNLFLCNRKGACVEMQIQAKKYNSD